MVLSLLSTPIITQEGDISQIVKTILFPDVQQAFNGEEPRNNKIRCPFHRDKTPSLQLYENGFYCFGCGESGDSISFVAKLHHMQPLEAAKAIAKHFDLPVRDDPLSVEDKQRLKELRWAREKKKQLARDFNAWVKDATSQVRGLAEAIRLELDYTGVDIDPELLPLAHNLPLFEWWADILNGGTDEEKAELYRCGEFRRWFS